MRLGVSRRGWVIGLLVLSLPGWYGLSLGTQQADYGVNDSGAEWDKRPASGIRLSSSATLDYFSQRGCRVIRLPLAWESLQPRLGGELDPQVVAQVKEYLRSADQRGLQVILDIHNCARYSPLGVDSLVIGDPGLSLEQFAGLWGRLARALRDSPGVYGYGLMNEPVNILTDTWKQASQAALTAIRQTGDRRLVLVPGSNWSSCQQWVSCHEYHSWIEDPADNFVYEAHLYWDGDADPLARLKVFVDWCLSNGVRGFIGETGCPARPQSCAELELVLAELNRVHMGATLWAAGDRWPEDYPLSLQPTRNFSVERPQLQVLRRHLGRGTATRWSDWCLGYQVVYLRLELGARTLYERFWRGATNPQA